MSQGEQVIWLIIVMVSEFHSIKPMSGAYVRVLCEGGIRSSSITFTEAMKLKAENKKYHKKEHTGGKNKSPKATKCILIQCTAAPHLPIALSSVN